MLISYVNYANFVRDCAGALTLENICQLIGSCITSIGALMNSKADVFFLTNEKLLGTCPFTIETIEDMSTYSMGVCARVRARNLGFAIVVCDKVDFPK